ncbi:MAG: hypothetical protein JNN15_20170 [Blastocatellia bacterium]|nr:hypothetical protein [Blastocatellia bacterium]
MKRYLLTLMVFTFLFSATSMVFSTDSLTVSAGTNAVKEDSALVLSGNKVVGSKEQKVFVVYQQATRRLFVAIYEGKVSASYFLEIKEPFSQETEVKVPFRRGSPDLAGDFVTVKIKGVSDNEGYNTSRVQVLFNDSSSSLAWAEPFYTTEDEVQLRACVEGCVFAAEGYYEPCVRRCIDLYGKKGGATPIGGNQ